MHDTLRTLLRNCKRLVPAVNEDLVYSDDQTKEHFNNLTFYYKTTADDYTPTTNTSALIAL